MTFFYDLNKRLADLSAKQDRRLDESRAAVDESAFSKLAKEIGKNPKIKNPAAVAATIGREKYGQKAMTKKAMAGKKAKHHNEMDEDFSPINEKFAEPAKINPAKKGMFAGKNKAELQKQYNHLKASGPHHKGSPEYTKMKELAFAIRAKSGWGKMDEADMDEGNDFTGERVKAIKAGKDHFTVGGKTYKITGDTSDEKMMEKKEPKSKGTAFDPETAKSMFANKDEHPRHDVKDTGYSKRYTRKHEDDMEKDDEVKSDEPKKKGRPKSTKPKDDEPVTKGSYKYKMVNGKRVLKDKVKEDGIPVADRGEYDNEGSEVKGDMHTVIRHATKLEKHLRDSENLPTWVIEKIGQIKGMMASVSDYILSQHERGVEQATGEEGIRIAEKITKDTPTGDVIHDFVHSKNPKFAGKSKKERINQALGASYAMKKDKMEEDGKPDFLDLDKDGNKTEPMKQAVKQAKSNKEKKVEETTTSGSVATATPSGKSSKGGMSFGKGVYESIDQQVEQMITESISVQENVEECGMEGGQPSITVQADGEEAAKLMMLLKLAGLDVPQAELDENEMDWPTDQQTLSTEPNLRTYSGGLNGPKSTGQSTTVGGGIPNYQTRRQVSMEESVKLERNLFKTWQDYKG